jgi:hypothetical protein
VIEVVEARVERFVFIVERVHVRLVVQRGQLLEPLVLQERDLLLVEAEATEYCGVAEHLLRVQLPLHLGQDALAPGIEGKWQLELLDVPSIQVVPRVGEVFRPSVPV